MLCLYVVCVFLLLQEESSNIQDDFTNIATIECANQNGDVAIPVDAARFHMDQALDLSNRSDELQVSFNSAGEHEYEKYFSDFLGVDSSEVLRRAKIYAAQEAYKKRREMMKQTGSNNNVVPDAALFETQRSSHIEKKKTKYLASAEPSEMGLQDLENSDAEHNLQSRTETKESWPEHDAAEGRRPDVPPIGEELEAQSTPTLLSGPGLCLTQRDVDLSLPNSVRSPRQNLATEVELDELNLHVDRKPESILKDRPDSARTTESALNFADSPSTNPSRKRIRFYDENWLLTLLIQYSLLSVSRFPYWCRHNRIQTGFWKTLTT